MSGLPGLVKPSLAMPGLHVLEVLGSRWSAEVLFLGAIASSNQLLNESIALDGRRDWSRVIQ